MSGRTDIIHSFREWRRLHRIVESLEPKGEPTLKFVYRVQGAGKRPSPTIAVLPAAFNPLTAAHEELLDAAERVKRPSELLLVLDKKTIDKDLYGASPEDRLLMLELFACGRKKTSVAFSSHGLFIDKARALRRICPEHASLYFIVGYDTLVRLFDPRYYEHRERALEALFAISRFLVANRGGSSEASVKELLSAPENERYKGYIEPIRISDRAAAISSTDVRKRVEMGLELSWLVPGEVENFIRETGLYAAPERAGAMEPGFCRSMYNVRCDIMRRLCSAVVPEGKDIHVGRMVDAVMRGEEPKAVIEKYLQGHR